MGAEPRHAQPKLKGIQGLAEAWLRHQGHGQLDAGVTNKMHVVGLPQFSPALQLPPGNRPLPLQPSLAMIESPAMGPHGTAWEPHNQGQRRRGGPMRPDVVSQGPEPSLVSLVSLVSLGAGGRRHPPRLVNQGFQPSWSLTGDGLISSRALPLRKSGHTPNHSPTIDPCTPPPTPTPNHNSCRSSVSLETSPWASSTTSAPFCCSQPRSC